MCIIMCCLCAKYEYNWSIHAQYMVADSMHTCTDMKIETKSINLCFGLSPTGDNKLLEGESLGKEIRIYISFKLGKVVCCWETGWMEGIPEFGSVWGK